MTTTGILVTLLFLSYSLLLERSCTERFGRLGLEELWRLRTASDRDQPAKQLIACTVTRGLQLGRILGNDSKLVMIDDDNTKVKKSKGFKTMNKGLWAT